MHIEIYTLIKKIYIQVHTTQTWLLYMHLGVRMCVNGICTYLP